MTNESKENGGSGKTKSLTKEEARKLFEAFDKAEEKVVLAEAAVALAVTARTATIKTILEKMGHKGPFRHNGNLLTVVERKSKTDPEATPTYHMRGAAKSEVTDI